MDSSKNIEFSALQGKGDISHQTAGLKKYPILILKVLIALPLELLLAA
ncbi:hypothetical protein [uncultured Methanobrevibacter sp.]|nr:hypothetical protein [uncultured Methanobrevibacter sp.]